MASIPPTPPINLKTGLGDLSPADPALAPSSALHLLLQVFSSLPASDVSETLSRNVRTLLDNMDLPSCQEADANAERKTEAAGDSPTVIPAPAFPASPSTLTRTGVAARGALTPSKPDMPPSLPPAAAIKLSDKNMMGESLAQLAKLAHIPFPHLGFLPISYFYHFPLEVVLRHLITRLYVAAMSVAANTEGQTSLDQAMNMKKPGSGMLSLQQWVEQAQGPILKAMAREELNPTHSKIFRLVGLLARFPQCNDIPLSAYCDIPISEIFTPKEKREMNSACFVEFAKTSGNILSSHQSCVRHISEKLRELAAQNEKLTSKGAIQRAAKPLDPKVMTEVNQSEKIFIFFERQAHLISLIETRIDKKLLPLLKKIVASSDSPYIAELILSFTNEVMMLDKLLNIVIKDMDHFEAYVFLVGIATQHPKGYHPNVAALIQMWVEESSQNLADLLRDLNRGIQNTLDEVQKEANWTREELTKQCQFTQEDWNTFIRRLWGIIDSHTQKGPVCADSERPANFSTLPPVLQRIHDELITLCKAPFADHANKTEKLIQKLKPESICLHSSHKPVSEHSVLMLFLSPTIQEYMLRDSPEDCNFLRFGHQMDQLSQALTIQGLGKSGYDAFMTILLRTQGRPAESRGWFFDALQAKSENKLTIARPTYFSQDVFHRIVRHGITMHTYAELQVQLLRHVTVPAMQAFLKVWDPPLPARDDVNFYSDWEDPVPTLLKQSESPSKKGPKKKAARKAPKPAKKAIPTTTTSPSLATASSAGTDTDTGFDFSRQLLKAYGLKDLPPWSSRIEITRPVSTRYDHVYSARLSGYFAKLLQMPMPEAIRQVLYFGSLHSNTVAIEAAITAAIFRTSAAGASRKLPHGLIALANRLGMPLRPEWHNMEDMANWMNQPHSRSRDNPVCKLAQRLHLLHCESDSKIFADHPTLFRTSVLNQCAALATHSTVPRVISDIQAKVAAASSGLPRCESPTAPPHLTIKTEQQGQLKLALLQLANTQAKLQAFSASCATGRPSVLLADQQNYINDLIGQCHSMASIITASQQLPFEEFLLCYFWQFIITAQTSIISISEYLGEGITDETHGTITRYMKTLDSKTRHSLGSWHDFCDVAKDLSRPQKKVFDNLDMGKGTSYPHRYSTYENISSDYLDHLMALSQLETGGFTRHGAAPTKALDPDRMLQLTITYMSESVSLLEHLISKRIFTS